MGAVWSTGQEVLLLLLFDKAYALCEGFVDPEAVAAWGWSTGVQAAAEGGVRLEGFQRSSHSSRLQ